MCVAMWRGVGSSAFSNWAQVCYTVLACANHYEFACSCRYGVSCVAVHPSGKLTLSVGKDRILRYQFFFARTVFLLLTTKTYTHADQPGG